jgi:putative PEP-CTERM system histidine kinase
MSQTYLSIAVICSILLFSLYLFVKKRRQYSALLLIGGLLCCLGIELFDYLALLQPEKLFFWKRGVLTCESLLPLLWLSYSIFFARKGGLKTLTVFQKSALVFPLLFVSIPFLFPPEALFYAPDFPSEKLIFLNAPGYTFYFCLLLLLVLILANLERDIMALPAQERYRVKFEIVGAGVIIAMLIVYYSQGLLYRTLNMALIPERSVVVLLGIGLMFYSFARRGGLTRLYVSRDLAYRSVVVLIVGSYFIVLGLLGEGMRYLGSSSQEGFFYVIAFLGGLFTVVLLLSETLKRKLKVFFHKNFYQQKYDYRNQWLQFTSRISSRNDLNALQEAILAFFCETFSIQGASLFLCDDDRKKYICLAKREMAISDQSFPCENSLMTCLAGKDWVFNVRDDNPDVHKENRLFFESFEVSFIVPLKFEGRLEGFIVLGRWINPDEKVIYEDYDLMKILARQAINSLMSQRLSEQLFAQREMAAIGKISTFVVHDLKNLVSSLGMMTENARDYINEPEFQQDMLETLSGMVEKMKNLISRLKNFQENKALDLIPCDLREISLECARTFHNGAVEVSGEPARVNGDPAELQKVVLNLILNGIEASGNSSPVQVVTGKDDNAFLRVIDRGAGISEEFMRNHLFKPFETTKKKGFGIGLYQCRSIIENHGGGIEVKSEEGNGTEFLVSLPLL